MRCAIPRRRIVEAIVPACVIISLLILGIHIADNTFFSRTASTITTHTYLHHDDDVTTTSTEAAPMPTPIEPTELQEEEDSLTEPTEPQEEEDKGPTEQELDSTPKEVHLLKSNRNGMGVFNSINVNRTGFEVMNPTLLELPRGCRHDFLVISRAFHVDTVINGTQYRKARQLATFANLTYNHPLHPEIIAGEWSKLLVEDFMGPEHHCKKQPKMDKYIGPEDMKLFWTRKRVPLIVFTHQTPDENLCEGMFAIDARAAVPELVDVLGEHALGLPEIVIDKPMQVRRHPPPGQEEDPRYQREKNWAPVQSPFTPADDDNDDVFFMVEPSQLFRWKTLSEPVEEVPTERVSAIEEPYPPGAEESWHSDEQTCMHDVMLSNKHVHQSTPMLSLTLCNRGACEPAANNTVLIGMIQRRYDPPGVYDFTWYERHIAAYSPVPPYTMMSVSKVLSYHGEDKSKYIWTGSMVYHADAPEIPHNRSHGFLDDEIWLSFGIGDRAPGWIDVNAKELIKDHYLCQGATQGYRNSVKSNL